MDKMKLAHEYALEMAKQGIPLKSCKELGWKYADAMQAETEKREDKTRPDVLLTKDKDGNFLHFHHEFGHKKCMDCGASLEEWQPDWSQAPNDATAWEYLGHNTARWHTTKKGAFRGADLFGYSGVGMLLVERPEPKCEVDWRVAPKDATHYVIFADGLAYWYKSEKLECFDIAPSFGIVGMLLVERPHGF